MMSKAFMGITIDKHISVGHIFTTVVAIFAGASAYYSVVYDIQKLKEADIRHERLISESRSDQRVMLDKIEVKLDRIYDKLDRKVDK